MEFIRNGPNFEKLIFSNLNLNLNLNQNLNLNLNLNQKQNDFRKHYLAWIISTLKADRNHSESNLFAIPCRCNTNLLPSAEIKLYKMMIGCSLSLLAIVAGMFLLAKTQKDNLSNFFKYVAYFVIFAGFFHIVAAGAMFTMKRVFHCGTENCEMESKCHEKQMNCKHMRMECGDMDENCEKGMMMEKCILMKEGKCEEGMEGMEKGKNCCKDMKGMKCDMKKDSVVVKK